VLALAALSGLVLAIKSLIATPPSYALGAGALLGLLNGGNILFYVHAHQSMPDSPATVFAGMNIGVVVLGALVGVFAFGEATTRWNRAGLALAVLAIGLIAWG